MKEEFLYYIWENKLLSLDLRTKAGEPVTIVHQGYRNSDSGPDFSEAKIKIGETLWVGSVEIHVRTSDWKRHGHQNDSAYGNVILHVVYDDDEDFDKIPVLAIRGKFDESLYSRYTSFVNAKGWIPCSGSVHLVQQYTWLSWLDRLVVERLEHKAAIVNAMLESVKGDWEEVLYRLVLHYFGMRVNGANFEMLANLVSLRQLLKHADNPVQVEAMLFGCAGFLDGEFDDDYPKLLKREFKVMSAKFDLKTMPKASWKFMRMRPANFPTIRLSQASQLICRHGCLFSKMLNASSYEEMCELLSVGTSEYWNTHYLFDKQSDFRSKKVGQMMSEVLVINVVAPMLFCYGMAHCNQDLCDRALSLLESVSAERNTISRNFAACGVEPHNAVQSQAMIQLYENYCKPRRCLECRIAKVLLKSTE